jgi:hypothetical protein
MKKTLNDNVCDVFGRPRNSQNTNSLYGNDGKLKEMFRPIEKIKKCALEKPMTKKKDKEIFL